MARIKPYVDQLMNDRDTLAENISAKGVEVEIDETITSLAQKVADIPSVWTRPSDWWDTKTILSEAEPIEQNDITYYPAYIMLLADWDVSTTVERTTATKATYGDAFIFSDEPDTLYVGNQTHTWDTSKDKPCSLGYKTRYIVVYITNKTANLSIALSGFKLMECIFGEFTSTSYTFGSSTDTRANPYLVNFETLDTFLSTEHSSYCTFKFCNSLKSINLPNLTTLNSNYAFQSCYSLTSINLPNLTTINDIYAFVSCPSLTIINLHNLTTLNSDIVFQDCYSLTSINLPNLTTITSNYLFYNCYSLTQLELLSNITLIKNTQFFTNCKNLRSLILSNEWSLELNVEPCDMTRNTLLDIISKLKDLTGETSKTFTFGADNLAKLTSAEIQIATDKNWILN